MSEIFNKIYHAPELQTEPDAKHWHAEWRIGPDHDARKLPGVAPFRSTPRPVGGPSLSSRIKSLFK